MTKTLENMIKKLIAERFEDVDVVFDFFKERVYTPKMTVIETVAWVNEVELIECSMCGELEYQDNVVYTETRASGGIGLVCPSCEGDM